MTGIDTISVVALVGSLRADSVNRRLFERAQELAPDDVRLTEAPIRDVPLFDDDLITERSEAGMPASVQLLRSQLRAADAILFVSPEYNYSIPGVLKNAIDWASRGAAHPFADKPVAIMGASGGMRGTVRMQYHLRQACVYLDAHPINKPEVLITGAAAQLGPGGELEPATAELVREQLLALAAWTRRLRG
ncbi:MAG: NADPH-dependent reductase [Thermoleophilia bacterium]|nr:NADPH-dependent reductase [Thermoleophilia bacterium]